MAHGADALRHRGPGFAGLVDEDSVDAAAALLEEVAAGGAQVTDRVWEQAARAAATIADAKTSTSTNWSGPSGPSPEGHRPPELDRSDRPV